MSIKIANFVWKVRNTLEFYPENRGELQKVLLGYYYVFILFQK